ncbi:hypothetical protein BIY24_13555 [Halobacteriovorax marinus]|uniref:LON peptidase substrate-binding domain-containing protein n=1 Tax=Halobacteriovorax marinus TaxID=97084 RepID=UPI000BC351EE|nr:LON peptidase substrate-binding domain-containing protein [Halobacteriovorax marinus]ATH08935.1 hypothetical protein BIY24_13555 [Halobacteriovorax marinus]
METLRLPVLPIPNVVLFSRTSLPIYILEPVYIDMVKKCIRDNTPIAISKAVEIGREDYKVRYSPCDICGYGRPVILEENVDGTLKVLIKAIGRVRLLNVEQNLPYLVYEAEYFNDKIESEKLHGPQIQNLKKLLDNWLEVNILDSFERETFANSLTSIYHIIDYICMFLVQDPELRQLLLENNSLFERIQLLNSLFEEPSQFEESSLVVSAIKRYEEIEKTSRIAH